MGRRTKRVKVCHSSSHLTDLSQFPSTFEGVPLVQPFPSDFPTEVWLEVHLCFSPAFPCAKQHDRFWRRLNYGTYFRFTGHQKPYRNYSSGQCALTFGRPPYDVFIISTYPVSRDLRAGILLCFSYTRLVKYDSVYLTPAMNRHAIHRCAESMIRHGIVSDGKSVSEYVPPVPTNTRCKRQMDLTASQVNQNV